MRSVLLRSSSLANVLGLLTIHAGLTLLTYLIPWEKLFFIYPSWAAQAILTIAVLRFLAVAAIWTWSKAGVIAYVLVEVAAVILWALVGRLGITDIPVMLGTMFLLKLVWRSWAHMPWTVDTKNA